MDRGAAAAGIMTPEARATLQTLLDDAERCPRLSDWEEQFLASMRGKLGLKGAAMTLSDKQAAALGRIEKKVYACG